MGGQDNGVGGSIDHLRVAGLKHNRPLLFQTRRSWQRALALANSHP